MCSGYVLSSPFVPYCFILLSLPSVHGGGGGGGGGGGVWRKWGSAIKTNCYCNALLHCHGNANLVEIHKERQAIMMSSKSTLTGVVTSLTRITQCFLDVWMLARHQHTEATLKLEKRFSKSNPQCLHCFLLLLLLICSEVLLKSTNYSDYNVK